MEDMKLFNEVPGDSDETMYILWTNADELTSRLMVMMYATNSMINQWWKNVTVIIWGSTAKLAAENPDIQEHIKIAQRTGVKFSACIACARQLGVIEKLQELEIEVIAWGEPLTNLMRESRHLISV